MSAAIVLAHLAGLGSPGPSPDSLREPGPEVAYVDASLAVEGTLLEARFLDLDGEKGLELVLAVRTEAGRELRFYALAGARFEPMAPAVVPIKEDVVAFGFADLRPDPGRELFFFTRTGAWSYSLHEEGYRGNVERLAELDLLYDVPDPDGLPYWEYVLKRDGGDVLLLPGRSGLSIWSPREEAAADDGGGRSAYRETVSLAAPQAAPEPAPAAPPDRGGGGVEVTSDGAGFVFGFVEDDLFLREGDGASFLSQNHSYAAPGLADVDGDGELDLLRLENDSLAVHLGGPGGFSATPDRTEALPAYLRPDEEGTSYDLRLVDLDRDGDADLVAEVREEADGFANSEISLIFAENTGARLFPPQPRQLLRFAAAELNFDLTDVDGDGQLDLFVRKFELPSLVETVVGLEFTLSYLLYPGLEGEAQLFERRPALKESETFDETSIQGAIAQRRLRADCSGDGIVDLVEVDLRGRIAVRRLRHEKSFFRGARWELDSAPWKRFDVRGAIFDLSVGDVNGDGLGDLISKSSTRLTVLLSDPRGGR